MPVWETLAIAAVSGIAVPVFQSLWDSGGKAIDRLSKGVNEQTRQLIFNASAQYTNNYTERHGTLKVLGMREPIELESVYTTVQLLSDPGEHLESLADQEARFRRGKQRQSSALNGETTTGLAIAQAYQYLMVLGTPGSGKSTLLKRVGIEALKGKKGQFDHGCIPVFIELKRFNSSELELEVFISREFEISGFPDATSFTQRALEQGKFLLLLDGLDEVPQEQLNRVIAQIQDFVDHYAQNRFMISCRTGAIRGSLPRFVDVAIADFDDAQVEQFIHNWFHTEADQEAQTADRCWAALNKPQNAAARELAHTPLLLTFLCRVFDRSQQFPSNRSILYRKALRILLEEWASEKRIARDEIYQGLHTEAEEVLLSEIAYQGFIQERFFFAKRDLVETIKTFLTGNLKAPQSLDGEAILDAIVVQQGILVKRAEDVYSFSHFSLQEYLAAQYIADNHKVEEVVQQQLTNTHWQDVFVLIAGLLRGGADDLLLAIERATWQLLKGNSARPLRALLTWADTVTGTQESQYDPTAKQAIAIAWALALTPAQTLAKGLAPTLTRKLTDAIAATESTQPLLELVQKLQKLAIFQSEPLDELSAQLQTVDHLVTEVTLKKYCWDAFDMPTELNQLSNRDIQQIRSYLYGNQLLLRCQQAAMKLEPQTWDAIAARMLKMPAV